jgi:hypothetical protein
VPRPTFTVTLVAMPGVDGIKSFRALLKAALRRYGLRAIDIRECALTHVESERARGFPSHPPTRETPMTSFSERIRGQKTGVFKVADFGGGREAILTIDYLEEEVEIFGNAEFLLNTLGDDPEKWKGQCVVLYLDQYEYGNDRGYTIRIKLPGPASKPAVKEGVILPPSRGDGSSKNAARSSSSQPDRETDLDDQIPF